MRPLVIAICIILVAAGIYLLLKHKTVKDHLTLYGNVDVRQVDLGFRVLGRVDAMPFQEGDTVRAGSLLAYLDKQPFSDEVRQQEANVTATKVSLNNQQRIVERRKEIVKEGVVAQEEYETDVASRDALEANLLQAKASLGVALTNLQDTELYAPADGSILTRIREPGTIVNVGDPIYTLSLSNPSWVRAFVPEPDLGRLYPNMKVDVITATGRVYKGTIGFISPIAEFTPKSVETTQLRTDLVYRFRVVVDNPDMSLKQGMPVTVKLQNGL
jgi:HlyD family secretion protein